MLQVVPSVVLNIAPGPACQIAAGEKTWEMRSRRTHFRGFFLVRATREMGGRLVALARLVDCIGPLSIAEFNAGRAYHRCPESYTKPGLYAWVLGDVRPVIARVSVPIPRGSIIWSRIDPSALPPLAALVGDPVDRPDDHVGDPDDRPDDHVGDPVDRPDDHPPAGPQGGTATAATAPVPAAITASTSF